MKALFIFSMMIIGSIANAHAAVDQDLQPTCTAVAEEAANVATRGHAGTLTLVDIFVRDMSTFENPDVNKNVLVEYYQAENMPGQLIVTTEGKISLENPDGECEARLQ